MDNVVNGQQLDDNFKAPTKPKHRADDKIDKSHQDQRDRNREELNFPVNKNRNKFQHDQEDQDGERRLSSAIL